MSDLTVVLAWPWTSPDGKAHKADAQVTLPRDIAQPLLRAGRARPAPTGDDTNDDADDRLPDPPAPDAAVTTPPTEPAPAGKTSKPASKTTPKEH